MLFCVVWYQTKPNKNKLCLNSIILKCIKITWINEFHHQDASFPPHHQYSRFFFSSLSKTSIKFDNCGWSRAHRDKKPKEKNGKTCADRWVETTRVSRSRKIEPRVAVVVVVQTRKARKTKRSLNPSAASGSSSRVSVRACREVRRREVFLVFLTGSSFGLRLWLFVLLLLGKSHWLWFRVRRRSTTD